MKKTFRFLMPLLIIILFATAIKAQVSAGVYDLAGIVFSPQTPNDSANKLRVVFKITDISLGDTVFVDLGSTQYGAEILSTKAKLVTNGSNFSLNLNGEISQIYNNCANLQIILSPNQNSQLNWLAVSIKSFDGYLSEKKYYKVR
jgi:hypothetical protein